MEFRIMIGCGKFEYFLNAVFYTIWRWERNMGKALDKYIYKFCHFLFITVPKPFITKRRYEILEERYRDNLKNQEGFFYNKKSGFHIESTKDTFRTISILYSGLFAFAFFGIGIRIQGKDFSLLMKFAAVLPPVVAYDLFLSKYVISNNRYLIYFRKFEKQDEQWLRKWKWITAAYYLGSLLSTGMGLLLLAAIYMWR